MRTTPALADSRRCRGPRTARPRPRSASAPLRRRRLACGARCRRHAGVDIVQAVRIGEEHDVAVEEHNRAGSIFAEAHFAMNARSADAEYLRHARLAPDALWRRPPGGALPDGQRLHAPADADERRRRPVRHLLDERDPDRRRADALQLCAEDDGARRARLANGNRDDGVRRRIRRGRRCGVIRRVCRVETGEAAPPEATPLRRRRARNMRRRWLAAACEGAEPATAAATPLGESREPLKKRQPRRRVQPPARARHGRRRVVAHREVPAWACRTSAAAAAP